MRYQVILKALMGTIATTFVVSYSSGAFAVDADAAQGVAKQNGCFKCHAVEKHKDGPAYRDIAAKYKARIMPSP